MKKILLLSLLAFSQMNIKAQAIKPIINAGIVGRQDVKINLTDTDYLPVSIINGKQKGKTVAIIAGIHGYEYPPIVATKQLLQEINPERLKGTLVIIPVSNVGAFYQRVPFLHPDDKKNLNNVFPGSADGTITERIANWITQNVIADSDVFIDIHGGDANEDLVPFACYYNDEDSPKNTQIAHQLSMASALPFVVSYPYNISKTEPAKYAFKQAVQDGKIALSLEAGKLGNVQFENVEMLRTAVYNILHTLGVYDEKMPERKNQKAIFLDKQSYVKVPKKGIFYSQYESGNRVNEGDKLGYITDEFGNILTEIFSPASGIILYKIATPPVNEGETLFCIGS